MVTKHKKTTFKLLISTFISGILHIVQSTFQNNKCISKTVSKKYIFILSSYLGRDF